MVVAKLTSKGRLTVPLIVRKTLDLQAGGKVRFFAQGNGFKMVAFETQVSKLKGRFAGRVRSPVELQAMNRAIEDASSSGNYRDFP